MKHTESQKIGIGDKLLVRHLGVTGEVIGIITQHVDKRVRLPLFNIDFGKRGTAKVSYLLCEKVINGKDFHK